MNKENGEIELYSSIYELEINQICAILDENDIPYMRKDYDIGSYMNVYFGQSNKEKNICTQK